MALTEFLILRKPQSGCLEERTAPDPSQLGISCTASLRDPPARCVSARPDNSGGIQVPSQPMVFAGRKSGRSPSAHQRASCYTVKIIKTSTQRTILLRLCQPANRGWSRPSKLPVLRATAGRLKGRGVSSSAVPVGRVERRATRQSGASAPRRVSPALDATAR